MNVSIDNGTAEFVSFLSVVRSTEGKARASQVNFLFQHYAYTENHKEVAVASRLMEMVNAGKWSTIQAQCEKFNYFV